MPRSRAEELIRSAGGRTSKSVSKKTDFLVEGKGAGSKLRKARALDVTIIEESKLMEMLGEG